MKVAIDRASSGLALEFARGLWEGIKGGAEITPAMRDALVQAALAKLRPHVVAALRAAGLDVPDDVELTPDSLRQILSDKTGLEIASLDAEGIKAAIRERVARKVSDALGVEVSNVMDPDALRAEVKAAAVQAIQSGRANALISSVQIRQIRQAATWARAGVAPNDRRRYLLRWYQKKYRRTHREVWDRVGV